MNSNLAKEWNYEKNKIKASEVLYGGDTKYWWICDKGHEWQASIIGRKTGNNCPYCSNSSLKIGYNDLQTMNPNLAKEWNYEKNKIKASEVLYGGNTKYWWICDKGHDYQMSIYKRKNGGSCIYCNSSSFLSGYNDLQTMNPNLAKEWNYEKNKIKASEVLYGGDTKYWWMCNEGHEWQTSITSRKAGNNCPYCSRYQSAVTKEESFGSLYPELLKEWNYIKNKDVDPYKIRAGSSKKAWWICSKGHEYYSQIYHRSNGVNCPICYRENQTSFPEQAVFYYLKKVFVDCQNRHMIESVEIDIFIPSLKLGIEYDGMYFHKGKKSEEKEQRKQKFLNDKGIKLIRIKECDTDNLVENNIIYYCYSNHHTNLKFAIENLVKIINNEFNLNKKVFVDLVKDRTYILESYMQNEKENSIMTKYPEIAKEWNYEKNGELTPYDVMPNSTKKVWWIGNDCGHVWETTVQTRTSGSNCPYCSPYQSKVCQNNCLATLNPILSKEWNYEKNGNLTPYDVRPGSDKKVWWKCSNCGDEWLAIIKTRNKGLNSGCPKCNKLHMAKVKEENNLKKIWFIKRKKS